MYMMIGNCKYPCKKSHLETMAIWSGVKGLSLPIPTDAVIKTYFDDGTFYTEDRVSAGDHVIYENDTLIVKKVHASLPEGVK